MFLQISNPFGLARRLLALGLCGSLAACGGVSEEPAGPSIQCAIGPGSEFAEVCTLERISESEFIIHHPDGGFRRFAFDGADGAIAAADGAEPVGYEETDSQTGIIEFGLSVDRYRLDRSVITAGGNE